MSSSTPERPACWTRATSSPTRRRRTAWAGAGPRPRRSGSSRTLQTRAARTVTMAAETAEATAAAAAGSGGRGAGATGATTGIVAEVAAEGAAPPEEAGGTAAAAAASRRTAAGAAAAAGAVKGGRRGRTPAPLAPWLGPSPGRSRTESGRASCRAGCIGFWLNLHGHSATACKGVVRASAGSCGGEVLHGRIRPRCVLTGSLEFACF
mmetsp:Transcript_53526/g.148439  ORF Transcript_53526/g.148439 Transcript_53526/m.148439 type:complete len:208 (-) Transcript_53526:11-634(-)